MEVSRAAEALVDSDDSDTGNSQQVGRADARENVGEPWKRDVRALVQEFAQEERRGGRGGAKLSRAASGPPAQRPAKDPTSEIVSADPNERRAEEEGPEGKLFFSRKPRDVDYTPASLDEYKQRYGKKGEKESLGRLGPDLDDDNLLMKKAVQEKVKQFSKELHRINKQRSSSEGPVKQGVDAMEEKEKKRRREKAEKENTRAKAIEYSKARSKTQQEPKPRPKPPPLPKGPSEADKEAAEWEEIERREARHLEDVEKVREIQAFISQIKA